MIFFTFMPCANVLPRVQDKGFSKFINYFMTQIYQRKI
jgi:hypothetical protein